MIENTTHPDLVNNKYLQRYLVICHNNKSTNYDKTIHQRHHILPKSMGGSNDSDNICVLTYREHFVAHRLLTKCTIGISKRKMSYAVWLMITRCKLKGVKVTGRLYNLLHKKYAEEKLSARKLPKILTDEEKEIRRDIHKTNQKIAALNYWRQPNIIRVRRYGYSLSDTTKNKIRAAAIGRTIGPYKKRSPIWSIPIDHLRSVVADSLTFTSILAKLQISSSIPTLVSRLDQDCVNYSHITRGSGNHKHK